MVRIGVSEYYEFDLTIPKRHMPSQAGKQFLAAGSPIDQYLIAPFGDKDCISLPHIAHDKSSRYWRHLENKENNKAHQKPNYI
jgi:hypothetical protein